MRIGYILTRTENQVRRRSEPSNFSFPVQVNEERTDWDSSQVLEWGRGRGKLFGTKIERFFFFFYLTFLVSSTPSSVKTGRLSLRKWFKSLDVSI